MKHLKEVGETYKQHFLYASRTSLELLTMSLAALVHSLVPFLFEKTVSGYIRRKYIQMKARGRKGYK